jgi:acetyl-CoA carboxylase carboxyl transferase subunit beta
MIAKIIAHGASRGEAIAKMKRALEELVIEGIDTNADFLLKIITNYDFIRGNYDTSFVEKRNFRKGLNYMIVDKIKKREVKDVRKENPVDIPAHKWVKCDKCKEIMYKDIVQENFSVCPNCGHHFRLSSRRRVMQIADEGTFCEFDLKIDTINPLGMEEYTKKINALREKTGIEEAVKCGTCKINGEKVVLCIMDGNFLMGSMGTVVGEKITYSIEKAIEFSLPLIIFSVSRRS